MGSGSWSVSSFCDYSASAGRSLRDDNSVDFSKCSTNQVFKQRDLHKDLDPKDVIRECRDTDEHPTTIPVIVGIDVTGSMGPAAKQVASKLNTIITSVMDKAKDAEFLVMGIGDLWYDEVPVQASQFESDIRIAKQLDNIYFEGGGGGNSSESYSAAWYFGVNNTDLDCWKRGKKGVIITIGDEELNPDLPIKELKKNVGCITQQKTGELKSSDIYDRAKDKFNIFHIHVNHDSPSKSRESAAKMTFGAQIGAQRVFSTDVEGLDKIISSIVTDEQNQAKAGTNSRGEIVW